MIYRTRSNHRTFGITKRFLPNEPWFTCLVQRYPHCPENLRTALIGHPACRDRAKPEDRPATIPTTGDDA